MRRSFLVSAGLVGLIIVACASGEDLENEASGGAGPGADASAGQGNSGGGPGTGGGGPTAGATGTGGAAGTAGSAGGGADLDGGVGPSNPDASGGGSSRDGGPVLLADGGVLAPLVCRPRWKECGGVCVPESPDYGCSGATCSACSLAVSNGFLDCKSGTCGITCFDGYTLSTGRCVTTGTGTCIDGVIGQFETDVDCGGVECPRCPENGSCNLDTDCQSGICVAGVCSGASCSDGVKNARETDADCGGNCGPTCLPGDACSGDEDCARGPCESGVCGCEPLTCEVYFPGQCGSFDDECGGNLDCTCDSGDVCNAGVCCTPVDQCAPGAVCGTASDGCGGTLTCGAGCTGSEACVENTCITPTAFPYTPSNFDPDALDPTTGPLVTTLDCGVSTFDSATLQFGNWCGQTTPTPVVVPQAGGPDLVVLPMLEFEVGSGSALDITGDRPVALAVFGDATIDGQVDASASGATPGPGGNASCTTGTGATGGNDTTSSDGASGGGGGGFGQPGGASGAGADPPSVAGGTSEPTPELVPLRGGCAGGNGGLGDNGHTAAPGGGGGGAVQISAAGTITISGSIDAGGGGGGIGSGEMDGGGGGGSGGAVLIEGDTVDVTGWLTANGGGGASGNNDDTSGSAPDGSPGQDGQPGTGAPAAGGIASNSDSGDAGDGGGGGVGAGAGQRGQDTQPGSSDEGGAGGGGGGVGRIRINASSCTASPADLSGVVSAASCGHCFSGTQDGDEAGVDCGGADCALCSPEANCTSTVDSGHQYFVCPTATAWTSARDLCSAAGLALVSISSVPENAFVDGIAPGNHWIGFTDLDAHSVEGTFVWVSGESPGFTNWSSGEPNDSGGNEDCAEITDGGGWNDLPCTNTHPYICEQL